MNIEINEATKPKGIPAGDIPTESLFRDSDGDLYLKINTGVIRFGDKCLVIYSETELACWHYLQNCTQVEGEVSITVNLKG